MVAKFPHQYSTSAKPFQIQDTEKSRMNPSVTPIKQVCYQEQRLMRVTIVIILKKKYKNIEPKVKKLDLLYVSDI